ncbi:antirestriction protein, partial [Vibrio parahaemolyticus]|nr:antirestriction protein [Vibrio parahaemolyticus]
MITASIVPTQERPNFYPSMTSNYLTVEQAVYHFSDQFLPDYSGGYWEFVT